MSVLRRRIEKLEQRAQENPDSVFVVVTIMEPGPNGAHEREPTGLAQLSATGPLLSRLPNESVDDLHKRAACTHPDVLVWITRYEEDGACFNAVVRG